MSIRTDFSAAAGAFVAAVGAIENDQWTRPGLGVWSVRDLVGHTSRSFVTLREYARPGDTSSPIDVDGPVAYYQRVVAMAGAPEAVADRGRRAGAALGGDPAGAIRALSTEAGDLVGAWPDDARLGTLAGVMSLAGYLPTRTIELTVHTLDLCRATGQSVPDGLDGPRAACLRLVTELAIAGGRGTEVLLALTGREPLPADFSLMI